ncbi:MAG: FKBP-type peptidyl-prolyl cis-trans isomerase [Prevotella sp.]|nr:FKBP-type peptidyl-prolyl cis-trans isomerase [Prevotella sp.]
MEKASNLNRYMSVAYQLYTVDDVEKVLVEEATAEQPFQFITGYGIALDAFEKEVSALVTGEKFDFILPKEEAYGDYEQERVVSLPREIFSINKHFDKEHVYQGAIIPLQNEDGTRFMGQVLDIGDDAVKIDLNHPLAGKTLRFSGSVVEAREATNDEIQGLINRMSGEGCCCCGEHGEGDCSGNCGSECGHHHHKEHGEGCHHKHGSK